MIEQFITLDIVNLCALLFVILIGLPHGAFDGAIAAHLGAELLLTCVFDMCLLLLRRLLRRPPSLTRLCLSASAPPAACCA